MTFKLTPEWDEAAWEALSPRARIAFSDHLGDWQAALTALLAEVDKRYHLSDERHLVNLTETGWTIKHPMICRPHLFTCPFNNVMPPAYDPSIPTGVYVGRLEHAPGGFRLALDDRVDTDA
jgi:hypothetical protein